MIVHLIGHFPEQLSSSSKGGEGGASESSCNWNYLSSLAMPSSREYLSLSMKGTSKTTHETGSWFCSQLGRPWKWDIRSCLPAPLTTAHAGAHLWSSTRTSSTAVSTSMIRIIFCVFQSKKTLKERCDDQLSMNELLLQYSNFFSNKLCQTVF